VANVWFDACNQEKIMKKLALLGACALSIFSWTQTASAALIYDESVSGDLLNGGGGASTFTSLGTLAAGTDNVKGVVGVTDASGYDAFDAVSFTLTGSATVGLGWYNTSWTYPVANLYDASFNLLDTQSLGSDIFGTLSAGDYFLTLSPLDTTTPTSSGSTRFVTYKLTFNVSSEPVATTDRISPVPLPATGLLLLGGLGGLATMRRRRRKS